MAYTYDLSTQRGEVRLRLADASGTDGDTSTYTFEDAEIDYFLSQGGSVSGAVRQGLEVLLVDGARRQKSFTLKGLSISDQGRIDAILTSLRALGGGLPTLTVTSHPMIPSDRDYEDPLL